MNLKDIPNWRDTVATHWRDTTAYLLSLREPCITIQRDELRVVQANRVLVGLDAKALNAWKPTKSWFMAVLLCPGDDLEPLAVWVERTGADPARIHFYVHREQDVQGFMRVWHAAGFPTDAVDSGIEDWRRFHRLFGLHLSTRILLDALPG